MGEQSNLGQFLSAMAIAFTVEHDMQLYTMPSKIAEANLGDTEFHLDRLSEAMGL